MNIANEFSVYLKPIVTSNYLFLVTSILIAVTLMVSYYSLSLCNNMYGKTMRIFFNNDDSDDDTDDGEDDNDFDLLNYCGSPITRFGILFMVITVICSIIIWVMHVYLPSEYKNKTLDIISNVANNAQEYIKEPFPLNGIKPTL